MRKITLLLSFVAALTASLMAQNLEQQSVVNVTLSEITQLIGKISGIYYDALSKRQKEGVLKLSAQEVAELRAKISDLSSVLTKLTSDNPLMPPALYKENEQALKAALLCQNCSGKIPEGGVVTNVENTNKLKTLLLARLSAISQLLPSKEGIEISQQGVLFSLEVHFSYLRQIAIAFEKAG